MRTSFVRWLKQARKTAIRPIASTQERQLLLAGRQASWTVSRLDRLNDLADAEFRVFSQWGEDGIIAWLVSNLEDLPRSFIEFGVENYEEANTRFLLLDRNWRGLIIDGSAAWMTELRKEAIYWRHDLTAVAAFITRDNINALFQDNGFSGEIGLLSIDIDGNDYWVWEAIDAVQPIIVICEYNGLLGDVAPITIPYEPSFLRFRAHYSRLYFGSSIAALRHLAGRKGYTFIGTNSNGVNAFFVRDDHSRKVTSRLDAITAYPPLFRESRDAGGELTFLSGMKRIDEIKDLPVVDVATNAVVRIGEIARIYSDAWARYLPA